MSQRKRKMCVGEGKKNDPVIFIQSAPLIHSCRSHAKCKKYTERKKGSIDSVSLYISSISFTELTRNFFGSSRVKKSPPSSTASSKLCRNCSWNWTISWMLPNNCIISSDVKSVSAFRGFKYRSIRTLRS